MSRNKEATSVIGQPLEGVVEIFPEDPEWNPEHKNDWRIWVRYSESAPINGSQPALEKEEEV